jgi:hypothetical protein
LLRALLFLLAPYLCVTLFVRYSICALLYLFVTLRFVVWRLACFGSAEGVTGATVGYLLDVADQCNAWQLKAVCKHFVRNSNSSGGGKSGCKSSGRSSKSSGGGGGGSGGGGCGGGGDSAAVSPATPGGEQAPARSRSRSGHGAGAEAAPAGTGRSRSGGQLGSESAR